MVALLIYISFLNDYLGFTLSLYKRQQPPPPPPCLVTLLEVNVCEKFAEGVTGWMLNVAEVQTTDALYTNESIHFNNRFPIWH